MAARSVSPPHQRRPLEQGRAARSRQWLRRAAVTDGYERHTLLLIGKSTLAACVAWVIARYVLSAPSPAFAPFSAVLMMQVTVYQSVVQSLRYVGAVSVGVALQAGFGFLAGPDLLTFALVAAFALAIGRWRPLGAQGAHVATAAFFAFSLYITATSASERLSQLGQIILLVLIGCGVGVLVNLVVLPPLRFRGAEYGVRILAQSMNELLDDMYPAMREADLDEERTRLWRGRATELISTAAQSRSAVETARESIFYNPRRLLHRHRTHWTFPGYGGVIDALERSAYQLVSMSRSLEHWQEEIERTEEQLEFFACYGDFLAFAGDIAELFGEIDEDRLASQTAELHRRTEEAGRRLERLNECGEGSSLPLGDPTRPYGLLLIEAARLMGEFQHSYDVLQRAVEDEASTHRPPRSGGRGPGGRESRGRDSGGGDSGGRDSGVGDSGG